jgi:hypothetical protein
MWVLFFKGAENLWVPTTHPCRSCNHSIFMDDATQDVGSSEMHPLGLAGRSRSHVGLGWCALVEGAVRPVRVVVLDVLAEDDLEVAPSEDEHAVEVLPERGGPMTSTAFSAPA